MKRLLGLILLLLAVGINAGAQNESESFTIIKELPHTPVINQGSTGTCWSFATTSLLESEIIRKGLPTTDLSEMYFVKYTYLNKAEKYLMYHGNNNFGQGGQAHDVIDVLREKGLSTYEAFPGEKTDGRYNHSSLVKELRNAVSEQNEKRDDFDASNLKTHESVLKREIGKAPKKVKTKNGKMNPVKFSKSLKINPDDYVELTSFNHHPFYKAFVLEVPDNWSHGLYYNVPIDELMETIYHSINKGYTVAWDGDTSEKTFSHSKGKADLPKKQIGKVNQKMRQETFLNRSTTDDHLMHLVGLSKDAKGRNCFYTKNSWGADSNEYGGYLHMTDDYVRLKTVAVLVHKDAIPENIRTKLNL